MASPVLKKGQRLLVITQKDINKGLEARQCKNDARYYPSTQCAAALAAKRKFKTHDIYAGTHWIRVRETQYAYPKILQNWIDSFDRGSPVSPIKCVISS